MAEKIVKDSQCLANDLVNDCISRQAAIKHLKKRLIETAINNIGVIARCDSIFEDTADNRIGPWLNELPSAQPETHDKRAEMHACDCISRQAAIDAVCKSECEGGFCGIPCPEVNALKALPPAQPQRILGRWEVYQLAEVGRAWTVQCSVCHAIGFHGQTPFCCECGADMRGE